MDVCCKCLLRKGLDKVTDLRKQGRREHPRWAAASFLVWGARGAREADAALELRSFSHTRTLWKLYPAAAVKGGVVVVVVVA